ncbi:MAG TPA: hypothetical protein VGR79_09740 [Stellaceae bacterium]|nr:hypothetical protein [Stellaceae bacterium]
MRTLTILRTLTLAIALSAPIAQAALAGQVQQAFVQHNVASAINNSGPYSNDAALSPALGN